MAHTPFAFYAGCPKGLFMPAATDDANGITRALIGLLLSKTKPFIWWRPMPLDGTMPFVEGIGGRRKTVCPKPLHCKTPLRLE